MYRYRVLRAATLYHVYIVVFSITCIDKESLGQLMHTLEYELALAQALFGRQTLSDSSVMTL